MSTLEAIKTNLARVIGELAESKVQPQEITAPPKPGMGDLAFGVFKIAKEKSQSPSKIAEDLAAAFKNNDPTIKSVDAKGPYLNFTLRNEAIAERVVKDIEAEGEKYGQQNVGQGKQIMLEYANVNTHKEFHVGHLRNILIGLSTHRLLDNAGWRTIPVSYINDLGSHVAKCLWLFVRNHSKAVTQPKKKGKNQEPAMDETAWTAYVINNLSAPMVRKMIESIPTAERTGSYLGYIYVEASKLLEENEDWKAEVSMVLKKLETHDPAWTLLWQETRRWSILEFSRLLQDFGAVIERQYYESELVDQSHEVVDELLEKGIAMESRGAIIVDLDAYPDPEVQKQKLGVFIIRKSDGTLIYAAKDIPLAELKFMEYPDQEQSIIVVDSRQSLYFKQLFATLKIMGYARPFKHLAYDFVTLPEGAMASRKGNVIFLKDLMEATEKAAREEILKRHGEEWNEGKVEHAAWCIASGGINFAILKQDPEKVIVFDMKKALSFDGDTGPYVQYAATRLNAILRKAGKISWGKADLTCLKEEAEKRLALCLAELPAVSARAAESFRPSLIAQWLLEAASLVNTFYRDVSVLEAPEETKKARLRLVSAAKIALVNALGYLGIAVPDAM
ncbi:MAG: arginine--tRNA ligase [Patescibacteria group bacterium]|nr:arginine--tRNA ligase [Patescibacteria group bacterium]